MYRLILAIDLLLINLSLIGSFYFRFGNFPRENFISYLHIWPFITILYLLIFVAHNLYEEEDPLSNLEIVFHVSSSAMIGFVLINSLAFFAREFAFPRTVIVLSFFINILLITLNHFIWKQIRVLKPERLVLVGNKKELDIVENDIRKYSRYYEVAACLYHESEKGGLALEPESWHKIVEMVMQKQVDQVIINAEDFGKVDMIEKVDYLLEKGIRVRVIPGLYEIFLGGMKVKELAGIPCWEMNYLPPTWVMLIKRFLDLLVSALTLTVCTPFFPLVCLLIKLDSKGPVFYSQERVGYCGIKFRIMKFRSMISDAESLCGPVLACEKDPRITRIGRILRKYRIDEIPQLLNVLKGEMSLIGPRPEREFFINSFSQEHPYFNKRLRVKPGLTGLAQILGRYETDPNNKLKYDLLYIQNLSLFLDFQLILMTVRVVLRGKGA
ncbi:MAG: sugar transferase [Candidatus Wallbacteria bacterium]|nr:sugar transferase [Candidatus Wallbacteria bacterium]